MTGRVLALHVGAGKTGSSAFQDVCEKNRDALRGAGIDYPDDPRLEDDGRLVNIGNAATLRNVVLEKGGAARAAANKALAWSQIAGSKAPVLLLSNEMLHHGSPERLGEVRRHAEKSGREVRVLFTVREATGHAVSVYRQLVRVHGMRESFEWFVQSHEPPFAASAERLLAAFGRERIVPVVYRADAIVRDLLAAAGAPDDLAGRLAAEAPRSNRSAGGVELALLLTVNAMTEDRRVREHVAHAILRSDASPAKTGRTPIAPGALARFRADAEKTADLLFDGDPSPIEPAADAPDWIFRPPEADPLAVAAARAAVEGWTAAFAARRDDRLRRGARTAARLVRGRFGRG